MYKAVLTGFRDKCVPLIMTTELFLSVKVAVLNILGTWPLFKGHVSVSKRHTRYLVYIQTFSSLSCAGAGGMKKAFSALSHLDEIKCSFMIQ